MYDNVWEPHSYLSHAHHGKDKVRILPVFRDGAWHSIVECNVTVLVEGDIDISYTQADNFVVVATGSRAARGTDVAKTSPHVLVPKRFALHLRSPILRWQHVPTSQGPSQTPKEHSHAFYRDGDERRTVEVKIDASAGKDKIVTRVTSGLKDLLVIKTTGSAFESFVRDEYTAVVEFTTVSSRPQSVSPTYTSAPRVSVPKPADGQGKVFDAPFSGDTAKGTPWDVEESASATLYKMGQRIIAENSHITSIPVYLKYIGIDNTSPPNAEVSLPVAHPSGLMIAATVCRQ
ncbi:tetrahydrobiopterin biosynthesis enzymes-like protein [Dichomitus squalens LYAD-421 SS1]|uniref:tetrahydrobiopterin biosynthesis enzymes-like protein n=1 Tax=Dichomitus squalens (strain LYAD-421) TaxID=732165 RepID=UPI00044145F3|nr:tetrahydrobiopterin biosynthesis enzymes-like protein [Dichomitus squalens LYAD-421 SS1]EJF64346.1 tetrahydrobiopterin biosynthesis enzymes-like protein [Dichomitus squalens LYAD-421 SS1]